MGNANRSKETGKFTQATEPCSKGIFLRLPESSYIKVKKTAGKNITDWIRQAVIEKLERETHSV